MNQNLQQEIMALVQAAMSGDKKASQQIESIMKAAQQGNPQAAQIAQMIEQVAKQLQQQTVSAKLGAKLKYIKSIKAAKGCKMRKVRKHESGGDVDYDASDLIPIVGTWKAFQRAADGNGSYGDAFLSLAGDAAMLVPGLGVAGKALTVAKTANKLRKASKAKRVTKAATAARKANTATKKQLTNAGKNALWGTGVYTMGKLLAKPSYQRSLQDEYVAPDNLQVNPIIRRSDLGNDSATTDTTWRYIPQ